ncbi:uncharacterized protein LOC112156348 [Oryzias melastigma]|uniref:uncharacterized protein LOC112156348 n=1 Tax=Oryzias melastigma TaxID=30732 RepID=UPI000CF7CEF2|nr:uncharacterized protein LOC112156348 [Oryzias melastigma]
MVGGDFGRLFKLRALLFLACSVGGLLLMEQHRDAEDDPEVNKAILEMLHINKVSASSQAKVHPYMKRIHQHLKSLEALDFERAEGILMQSFRSLDGSGQAPRGWIWFNVSSLDPLMLGAELVLFRKTLHPGPLSLTVTLHSTAGSQEHLSESPVLEERQLILDQRPSSGYDVFDVSAVLAVKPPELLGFQLRYTDESGSLVLHEALTQRLYSLDASSLREPLLVFYQTQPFHF